MKNAINTIKNPETSNIRERGKISDMFSPPIISRQVKEELSPQFTSILSKKAI
ncbi:MAG: hypothetical protein ACXADY_10075 [Candidatus Hodarchaeales archaeon]|jgi:hypothetical protein